MSSKPDVVLAFSGGLDTSFCVPYLNEQGYRVTTLLVDTGGLSKAERDAVAERARSLGAAEHHCVDAREELFRSFVIPFVRAGLAYQNQYPLLCSDRYVIVDALVREARRIGATHVAHGCTAMGNDQLRFDQTIRSSGDFTIVAPIRDLQALGVPVREYEKQYLAERGHTVAAKTSRYTINENCLGVTVSGSEIDEFDTPGPDTYSITAPPEAWPQTTDSVTVDFDRGAPVGLDGTACAGPDLLQALNDRLGRFGVGRGIYTGDTAIGVKGRIVFECPALTGLLIAHRALEEAVLTKAQNAFKPIAAQQWVRLVYEGFFHEPLKHDLDAFISSSQDRVTGSVTLSIAGGSCHAVALRSPFLMQRPGVTYAQTSDWTAAEAAGFIKLYGQSTSISAAVGALHGAAT